MASVKERVGARVQTARDRAPLLDHVLLTVTHYGSVNGSAQAGAVTYFGFLSFFPILALAFFVIGKLAQTFPDAQHQLVKAIDAVIPGVVGPAPNQIPISVFEDQATAVGLIGLVGLLYSGLGWLSGMRAALDVMFVMRRREQPNFLIGKSLDLLALIVIGITLFLSVGTSSLVTGLTQQVLDWLGLDGLWGTGTLLQVVGRVVAVSSSTVLFLAMFGLLAHPHLPRRALLEGAVVGAVGFEILKVLSILLIKQTTGQPAFQAFGVALILLVWINYFSRVAMYAAAWAYTHPLSVRIRAAESQRAPGAATLPRGG